MLDHWEPIGGDLFQLFQDGTPTPVTSFVDRSLSRAMQLDQLSVAIGWLPEQVIVAVAEEITAAQYRVPSTIVATKPGRVFGPTPAKVTVLVAPGYPDEPHPLRPYLWPVLDGDGELVLDAEETILRRKRISAPSDMHYAEKTFVHFTSHRVAITGKLALPTSVKSDYKLSLGLISPTLIEGFSAIKALGRIGQNKGRRWVHHVRYEWLTGVTCFTTTRAKKKLFGGMGPTRVSKWFRGQLRYPGGELFDIDLWRFRDDEDNTSPEGNADLQASEFCDTLEQACRSLGLGWTQIESSVRDIVGGTEARDVWTVDDLGSYSVPSHLISAR